MSGPGWTRRQVGRVREYLTMRRRLEDVGHDAARATAAEATREARQKRDAAEALLVRAPAEALQLGAESLRRLTLALASLEGAGVRWSAGMTRAITRVERFGARVGTPAKLDSASTSAQVEALRGLIRAEIALDPWLDVEIFDRPDVLKLRRHRWILAALITISPLFVALFVWNALRAVNAHASSQMDEEYTANRAIDGDPDTEWIPSGGDGGWLELRFPPRHVRTVRVLEGDTLPRYAAKEVRVEYFLHGESFPGGSHEFVEHEPLQWMEFDGGDVLCDRVRLTIVSHFEMGGAIAEVEIN
ncbi:MAG: discoidin domain-containing protein [Polyangiaceae bacterium]|jgi:hypothetical protein